MDIVLGVSMTPTTVRMALVEGDKADGAIVDHDTFDTFSEQGSATPVEQVVSAILGTRESAEDGGHQLKTVGVAWSDHHEAAQLRDALADAGIDDVMMVSELHAAGALAQAAGQSVGYQSTGLLFVDRDTATASVVQADGSISKVLTRSLHSADAMAVFGEMATAIAGQAAPPQGMFVVGSGVDVAAVQEHLAGVVEIPVSAPGDAALALARGAALASANAPAFDAATAGLAYSDAPAGIAPLAAPLADEFGFDELGDAPVATDQNRKPFLLVGSALTSIFVVGVVALAVSLAVSIRPTVDERPAPAQAAIVPSAPLAPPPPAEVPPPVAVEPVKAPPPAVQQAPVQEAAPRTVYVSPPAAKVQAPEVQAPAPAPEAPAPTQVPVPVSMPEANVPPPVVAPVVPPPVVLPPLVTGPPSSRWGSGWNPGLPQWQPGDSGSGYPGRYPGSRGSDDPGDQYPGSHYPSYPSYPGNQYPGNSGSPGSQYPGNSGSPGSQYPGNSGSSGNQSPGNPYPSGRQPKTTCFLIFCKSN